MKENTYLRAYLKEQAGNKKAAQVKPKTPREAMKALEKAPIETFEIDGQLEIKEAKEEVAPMQLQENVTVKTAKKAFKKKESK